MSRVNHKDFFTKRMNQLATELGDGSPERLAAELRLPPRNIQRYCAGENQPRLSDAVVIAKRAGVSLDWLTGLSEERVSQVGPVPLEDAPADTPPTLAKRRGRRRSAGR